VKKLIKTGDKKPTGIKDRYKTPEIKIQVWK
jgi:hypothetical protein